jgi:DNA excision repair protein ERCC-3
MIGIEHLEEDSDGKALMKARRSAGSMSAFSGSGGMVYMEYSTGKGKAGASKKPKDPSKRHYLFKKRYQ